MFHRANKYYKRQLEMLNEESPENFEIVEDFVEDLIAEGISKHRIYSYILWIRKALKVVHKRLDNWSKKDVRRVLNFYKEDLEAGKITENSMVELKKTLKKFFKWLGSEDIVNWFSIGKYETKVTPQDLISEEEFQRMMNSCMNSRDRAMLSLLYESGARIGEIGSMRIRDVSFDEYGAIVWLPRSKTVRRKIRIVYSARYLAEWLSDHPLSEDLNAPLWIKLTGKNAFRGMEYADIRNQIKKIAKRAGIKKRIYPHLFRHTRATRLLAKIPESIGAKYLGWVPGSDMVKVYVHLASEDVDEAILKLHGIKTNGNGKDLEVKQCPRCLQVNPAESRFCSRCGLPLTEEALKEIEEWEKRKAKALSQITQPDFVKIFMGLEKEIKLLKSEIERLKKEGGGE